jgi:hypothetical protein
MSAPNAQIQSVFGTMVRAVYQHDGETKLNIDYGHEETETIELWQVVK